MASDKPEVLGVEQPPPLPQEPPPGATTEERRKSLGFTSSWSSQPPARKYSLNETAREYKELPEESAKKEEKSEPQEDPPEKDAVPEVTVPESPSKVKEEIIFSPKDPKPMPKSVEKTKKVTETPAGSASTPPTPNTVMKMSRMEEEAIRERMRAVLLRQTAEILEAEGVGTKFTKDSFRRTFLNKVRIKIRIIISDT